MSIIAAFGDDDHTAADGPYLRVLKVRKWLYVFSACVLMISFNLYNAEAVETLVRFIHLPKWLLSQTFALTTLYLTIQYTLLCWQLVRTYDIILHERLYFRRNDELTRAKNIVSTKEAEIDQRREEILEKLSRDLSGAQSNRNLAQRALLQHKADQSKNIKIADLTPAALDYKSARLRDAEELLLSAERALSAQEKKYSQASGDDWMSDDAQALSLIKEAEAARESLLELALRDPASRPQYRALEIAVDILRIAPPPIMAVWSLGNLIVRAP